MKWYQVVWAKIKAFFAAILQFLKNKEGQYAIEELGKCAAIVVAVWLAWQFFFGTTMVPEARPYFFQFEIVLLSYAGIAGVGSNIAHE